MLVRQLVGPLEGWELTAVAEVDLKGVHSWTTTTSCDYRVVSTSCDYFL